MHRPRPITTHLRGICAGMAILDPDANPHRHPEEEILILADGAGIIECGGTVTEVGRGAMLARSRNQPKIG
jgi:mannose-6-phosphate isomerase-like protein (cupin superfamily)